MEAPREASVTAAHRHLFPLNFFTIGEERPRNWLSPVMTISAAFALTLAEAI